jgi:cell division protein FtsL
MTHARRTALVLALLLSIGCVGAGETKTASTHETRSLLVGGKWIRHLDEKQFFADGTYEARDPARESPIRGTWRLDDRRLRLTEENETTDHRIIAISETDLEMTFGSARQRLHYRRSLPRR